MKNLVFSFLAAFLFCSASRAQVIQVNAGSVIRTFDHNPAGINLNYLMDDDTHLNPAIPLQQSLKEMNVGGLRFPGGEKADNYLWSVPPYTSVNPHFATQGNCNWPNNDPAFSSNYLTPLSSTMDFDEFMLVCQNTHARPLIVVAGDAQYNTFCTAAPTLTSLITNAAEWVKYANITHAYKIKNWVIGNESFNSAAYDAPSTASEYAHDVIQFSQAMKAIDPTISVVANAKSGAWIDTLISIAGAYIDAIAVSNYPIYNWTNGYDTYRTGNPNLVSEINSILSSVSNTNIRIIVTEYNAIDWAYTWPQNNDLGHAIVNFQMFGDQMKISRVEDAYLWNTRWVNNVTAPQDVFDAVDANGGLNATGKALSMWGNNMLEKMVSTTNGNYVNSFAVRDSSGDSLNIFLINKDNQPRTATVTVNNFPALSQPNFSLSHVRLSGSSPADKIPVITYPTGSVSISGNVLKVNLSPHSINVLKMKHVTLPDTNTNPVDTTTVPPTTLTTVGIKSINDSDASVAVYPNPNTGTLHVDFQNPLTKEEEIRITNSLGIEIYSLKTRTQKNTINTKEIPNGVYFLMMGSSRRVVVKSSE
ncbi:hypothetical protein CNR22_07185 [Sphingobacteriaceae bacterium]|nr:hypothetical protein CNR22_07185 [Sphingobacteriaceae bacterium]